MKQRSRSRGVGRAFSLVEVLVAMMIIGGLAVAALNTLGSIAVSRQSAIEQAQAHALASDLLSEIMNQPYATTDLVIGFIGIETGDLLGSSRRGFDDVDDYDGWVGNPPQTKDGTELSEFADWRRAVTVDWVEADNGLNITNSESGMKRITVTVARGRRVLARVEGVRTMGADRMNGIEEVNEGTIEILPIKLGILGL